MNTTRSVSPGRWITFGGVRLEDTVQTIGFEESGVYYVSNSDGILAKMRRSLNLCLSDNSMKGIESSSMIYDLLMDLLKYTSKTGEDSMQKQYSKLQPVFDYIQNNYHKPIGLEMLAATINITPQYLCLLFKEIMGTRPFEYLNNVRINKSKDLMLKQQELTIKEIANRVGYEDASYFCSVFKRVEGISPGMFKKLHGI